MTWDEAKQMIGNIAPSLLAGIGAVIPIPGGAAIGGLAGKVLQQVLGTNQPDKILEIVNQDPNAALKLREAEMTFQLETMRIEKDKYALQLLDVQNARLREVSLAQIGKSDITFYSIAWIITLGFFGVLTIFITKPFSMTETVKDIVTMMLGYLAGNFTTVVSYFFGSSKSSADNKGMMAILQDKLLPPGK